MVVSLLFVSMEPSSAICANAHDSSDYLKSIIKAEQKKVKEMPEPSQEELDACRNYEIVQDTVEADKSVENVYSGAYLNDDEELVVYLSDETTKKVSNKISNIDKDIKVEYVSNTMSELIKMKKSISKAAFETNSQELDFVKEVYLDEENNCIVVGITDLTKEKEEIFKSIIADDSMVKYQNVEKTNEKYEATTLNGGRAIYSIKGGYVYRASIGFRAKNIGKKGLVSAGHFGNTMGMKIYADKACQKQIGKVTIYGQSGSVDACFIEITNSSYTAGNKIHYKDSEGKTGGVALSVEAKSPTKNTAVFKSGSSTFLTSGKVTSSSWDGKVGDIAYVDLVRATYTSDNGDSGGTIYKKNSDGTYSLVGIHAASGGTFVKASNILKSFGISRY